MQIFIVGCEFFRVFQFLLNNLFSKDQSHMKIQNQNVPIKLSNLECTN